MSMFHVIDDCGCEVFKSEDGEVAKRAANQAKHSKLNGCTVFHVEKRERVYTTSTLEEAIRGTPFDPAYQASGDASAAA